MQGLRETRLNALLAAWQRLCGPSAVLRFIDINLRGVGQVMFQNHPFTGLLFLAAIAWGALAADAGAVLLGGLLGLSAATLTARWLRVDAEGLAAGLYGYNGLLVGLALPTFLAPKPLLWLYVLLGAAVSVVAMRATANVTQGWRVSALTFPFVLTSWLMLLAAYAFAGLGGETPPFATEMEPLDPAASNPLDLVGFVGGVLHSISQVFLKGNTLSALLFLAGLAVASPAAALAALAGALLAVSSAHLLGAESELVSAGLLGFSPVLTAVALGTVFHRPGWRVAAYAVLGTLCTVVAQAALNVALAPLGLPALTAPFVLCTWLFLLPQQQLDNADDAQP
jgi:urea transporter